jgi:hypothetical protein
MFAPTRFDYPFVAGVAPVLVFARWIGAGATYAQIPCVDAGPVKPVDGYLASFEA